MKFPVVLVFSGLWSLLVYIPICHWVWGGGWLEQMGAMDFAGGLVLHANVGAAALVASIIVGRRLGVSQRDCATPQPRDDGGGDGDAVGGVVRVQRRKPVCR